MKWLSIRDDKYSSTSISCAGVDVNGNELLRSVKPVLASWIVFTCVGGMMYQWGKSIVFHSVCSHLHAC